jgi:hypothetical protein
MLGAKIFLLLAAMVTAGQAERFWTNYTIDSE